MPQRAFVSVHVPSQPPGVRGPDVASYSSGRIVVLAFGVFVHCGRLLLRLVAALRVVVALVVGEPLSARAAHRRNGALFGQLSRAVLAVVRGEVLVSAARPCWCSARRRGGHVGVRSSSLA